MLGVDTSWEPGCWDGLKVPSCLQFSFLGSEHLDRERMLGGWRPLFCTACDPFPQLLSLPTTCVGAHVHPRWCLSREKQGSLEQEP